MKKPIKDMTAEEKQERIFHLSHKVFDINESVSLLLRTEMENADPDKTMLDWLKNIEILEKRYYKLEAEYQTAVAPEIRKIKRIFEYEQKQLLKEYEREMAIPLFSDCRTHTPAQIEEKYKQKMFDLKKEQTEQKSSLEANVRGKLDVCTEQIYSAFMSAIKYLYR